MGSHSRCDCWRGHSSCRTPPRCCVPTPAHAESNPEGPGGRERGGGGRQGRSSHSTRMGTEEVEGENGATRRARTHTRVLTTPSTHTNTHARAHAPCPDTHTNRNGPAPPSTARPPGQGRPANAQGPAARCPLLNAPSPAGSRPLSPRCGGGGRHLNHAIETRAHSRTPASPPSPLSNQLRESFLARVRLLLLPHAVIRRFHATTRQWKQGGLLQFDLFCNESVECVSVLVASICCVSVLCV